jgi:hypothetical protein
MAAMAVRRHRSTVATLVLLGLALSPATPARPADEVMIYRCVAADGSLTLRDTPCARGERQQALEMQRPQDPAPRPPPAPIAPTHAPAEVSAAPPTVVVVQPYTPTYECTTPDGERYTSHDPAGNPRWVPLWTLGYPAMGHRYPRPPSLPPVRPATSSPSIGNGLVFDGIGRPTPAPPGDRSRLPALPPAVGLAATPGTWIRDDCRPLPRAEACQRLRDRHWELFRRYNSALQSERRAIDAEQRVIDERLAMECAP